MAVGTSWAPGSWTAGSWADGAWTDLSGEPVVTAQRPSRYRSGGRVDWYVLLVLFLKELL